MLDPSLFSKDAVPPEIAALNESILLTVNVEGTPTFEDMGATALQAMEYQDGDHTRFEDITIPADVPVGARVFFPKPGTDIKGALLHVHGGGFVFGGKAQNDTRLLRHSQNLGLVVVSVDYRLSPQHKYPSALNDCMASAEWLTSPAGRTATGIRH
jgi:acetyl esterase/lipase